MTVPRASLRPDYEISRIIKGGWHLAGDHGAIDRRQSIADMAVFVRAGITTMDCADIYAGVEALIGEFRAAEPELARQVRIHTKFVPDLATLATLDRRHVETIIDRSLLRLGLEQLDMVQFHWWDFAIPGHVETAHALHRMQRAGKIAHLAVTNYDAAHLDELLGADIPIVAHQLQYSLLDRRCERRILDRCRTHDILLLCYGTVAGGFLSERWLGRPEPVPPFANRSLVKYKLIIDDCGGWAAFQAVLRSLRTIALRHDSDIATVATRAILDRPQVAAAIVGATSAAHLDRHGGIGELVLDDRDRELLADTLKDSGGPEGDVYGLERDRNGPHGRIMKYELNAAG